MSEASTEAPTETVDQANPEAEKASEIDWKAKAREWEKRAKENKSAADELAQIREANKSEAERTAERLAAAEKDAADARREALKLRIATRYGIGDEDADLFLTASDEDTLTKQAERLGARIAEQQKRGNHVPREGTSPTPANNDERATTRALFGGTP